MTSRQFRIMCLLAGVAYFYAGAQFFLNNTWKQLVSGFIAEVCMLAGVMLIEHAFQSQGEKTAL